MKIYIYSKNDIQSKVAYIFTLVSNSLKDIELVYITSLSDIRVHEYVIVFNNVYHVKKNFMDKIHEIIKSNTSFAYLVKSKDIYITNTTRLNGPIIDIKKTNYHVNIFDKNANKHEYHLITQGKYSMDTLGLLQLYVLKYNNIFNKDISYESYKYLFIDQIKSAYCLVYSINDIMDLQNIKKLEYYNYRIVIAYKNLDYFSEKYLTMYCKNNSYTLIKQQNLLDNLEYLWFENIVFLNKNSIVTDSLLTELTSLHESFNIVNKKDILSIRATELAFYNNISEIKVSKKSYPSEDISYELLYNNIIEQRLLKCKGYDTILYSLVSKKNRKPSDMNKIVTMSVLCDKSVLLNDTTMNFENVSNDELVDWFNLFKSAHDSTPNKKQKTEYIKFIKQTGIKIFNNIIDNDLIRVSTNNFHNIVLVFDFFVCQVDKEIFKALTNIIKYLKKYTTYTQTYEMIKLILPLVIRTHEIVLFQELLQYIYFDFKLNNLLDLFPDNSNAIEIFIYITCNFNGSDNILTDIHDKRKKIENNLNILLAMDNIATVKLERMAYLNVVNFFLSYHGVSSRKLFELKTKLIRKICPDLNYKINTNFVNKKIKVCFVSNLLTRQHSVFKDRHQVIKQLADISIYDIYFMTNDDLNNDVKNSFGNAKHIKSDYDLIYMKTLLESMKLDVIVYCEIGMDPLFYLLSYMKLAKIQVNTWGHSDTSGIDTIDYFFSSRYYELEYSKSQDHYSEQLILLNSLCTYYINPLSRYPNITFTTRYDFGLSSDSVIYFCGQSLFKFTKVYYDYIIQILDSNPNAVMIMIIGDYRKEFINAVNHNIINRIHWSPGVSHKEYLNLINMSDIVLDTYPFGGCNSSLEAFALGKVVVTQPSEMINGRFTKGFYEKMDLLDCVCSTKEDYIKYAIKLADKDFRKPIEEAIMSKKDLLFNDKDSVNNWCDTLTELVYTYHKDPENLFITDLLNKN